MRGQVALIIPALNPEETLFAYVKDCIRHGFSHIVVVDDGSDAKYGAVFTQLDNFEEVTVLHHEQNFGKGRALKTAFSFCRQQAKKWQLFGVITVDSDGQHHIEDVCRISEVMDETSLILGCRDLLGENVPPKSRFGNLLTCRVFRLLYGKWISDTQTGLRGIPLSHLELMLQVSGERYEYETEMLITIVRSKIPIKEIPIKTIYMEENAGTHFRPVVDSVKIYAVMLKRFLLFTLFSLSSFLLDVLVFSVLNYFVFTKLPQSERIFWATVAARICSSIFNFTMNRKVVFQTSGKIGVQILKYYCLAAVQMLISAKLVTVLINVIPFADTVVKIIVDTILFIISYQIQQHWIFKSE